MKVLFFLLMSATVIGQSADCANPAFSQKVRDNIRFSVPVIDVDTLHDQIASWVVLDAREHEEFETSAISGAINVGYDDLDLSAVEDLPKSTHIAVYCSIGYRSEKVGEKLQKLGFENVSNVYGGIFEWANRGYPLESANGSTTDTLHTYSRSWSKWVDSDRVVKSW